MTKDSSSTCGNDFTIDALAIIEDEHDSYGPGKIGRNPTSKTISQRYLSFGVPSDTLELSYDCKISNEVKAENYHVVILLQASKASRSCASESKKLKRSKH